MYLTIFCWHHTNAQEINNIKSDNSTDDLGIPEGGLKIGDTIPEALWHLPLQVVNHPEGKDAITLNDYRGKLIILDFWATWCTACIAAMPKVQELQKQFRDSLVVMATTYEPSDKAEKFLKSNQTVKNLNLSSIVNNMYFTKVFYHYLIPHYVWINSSGRIELTTTSDQITAHNIGLVISSRPDSIRLKQDMDASKPLFLNEELLSTNSLLHHSILIKGIYDGLPYGATFQRDKNNNVVGISFTNRPLNAIFKTCIKEVYRKGKREYLSSKRIVVESSHKADFFKERYTFSFTSRSANHDQVYQEILNELNLYSGFTGTIETRKVKCYILRHIGRNINFKSNSEDKVNTLFQIGTGKISCIRNYPITSLVTAIDQQILLNSDKFIIDETGFKGPVDISITLKNYTLDLLKEQLEKYNLEIIEGERSVDMFVIRDAKPIATTQLSAM